MQYITRNMLNYLTFWVNASAQNTVAFIVRVLYCGGIVKEYFANAIICNCRVIIPVWVGCNELNNADAVQLLNSDNPDSPVLLSQTPVKIN